MRRRNKDVYLPDSIARQRLKLRRRRHGERALFALFVIISFSIAGLVAFGVFTMGWGGRLP